MSSTFSAKAGSLERLNLRMRCGWRWCACQMRCTVRSDRPTALAIARPVQWVASPVGSPQVSASTLATVAVGTGSFPGGRVLSRNKPSTPASAPRPGTGAAPTPAPPRRRADGGAAGHLKHRQPIRREQNDLGALDVLQRPVPIVNDRRQAGAILRADDDAKLLGHARRIAYPGRLMNRSFVSVH